MLISKEVEVRVAWQTEKHYENLGYIIPKNKNGKISRKEKILVKVEDLYLKSAVKIDLKCDYCGKDFKRRFADHMFIKNKKNYR